MNPNAIHDLFYMLCRYNASIPKHHSAINGISHFNAFKRLL